MEVKITLSATSPPDWVFEPTSKRLYVILMISPDGMVSTGPLESAIVTVAQSRKYTNPAGSTGQVVDEVIVPVCTPTASNTLEKCITRLSCGTISGIRFTGRRTRMAPVSSMVMSLTAKSVTPASTSSPRRPAVMVNPSNTTPSAVTCTDSTLLEGPAMVVTTLPADERRVSALSTNRLRL